MNDKSKFRLVAKSRQIGFSWIISGEGLHTIAFNKTRKVNYVSINQKEASDKIIYAKQFYYTIDEQTGLRPPIYTSAEFEFSLHNNPYTSYLISQPASSAIRGGEKDIYFDEFAHIRNAEGLYIAAVPATSRGGTRVTIISTPLGQSGKFFEIANDRVAFEQYTIHVVPWYECSIMSVDVVESTAIAPDYDTEERVRKWGTANIKQIYASMDLDSFQQEYECSFADESVSFYPWGTIINCVNDSLNSYKYDAEAKYALGIDVGKKIDKTVITVVKTGENDEISQIVKLFELKSSYEDQFNEISELITKISPSRVSIDATGVGAILAERLKDKFGSKIEEIVFTMQNKERWATLFKADMQSGKVEFPRHRELLQETHGIERKKTEAGNYIFRAKEGKHDDYYWSSMLGLYGEPRVAPNITFAW